MIVAGSDLLCPLPEVPRSVALELRPCRGWKPDASEARAAAIDAATEVLAREQAKQGITATSTVEVAVCDRKYLGATVSCVLSAAPDRDGIESVQCSQIDVDVTADADDKINTDVTDATCFVVAH